MKITIAFDAGCDMRNFPPIEAVELVLVPLKILLNDREIVDDGSISLADFQSTLDQTRGKTGTACPSVGDWQHIMERSESTIAITLSGAVSGSYQSACIARDLVLEEFPDKKIFVMNSVSGSGTMEFLVREAVSRIKAGADFDQVCQALQDCRSQSEIFFLLQNVDNLMSNGRLNPLVGRAVKALRLCLLSTVSPTGTMEVIAKVRGFEMAMDKSLEECVRRSCIPQRVIISHCLNPDGAQRMRKKLLTAYPSAQIEVQEAGPLCGYYAEKGGLIVALQR